MSFYRTITRASASALFYNPEMKQTEELTLEFVNETRELVEKTLLKNGRNGLRFMDILSWDEKEEKRYIDEAVFLANARKLEKPVAGMITRTIKADILTAYLCHRFNDDPQHAFATVEIVVDMGLKGKARERAILEQLPHDYVIRRCMKTGEVSDLYGMDLDTFMQLSKPEQ